jgi:hypothetical protein
MRSYGMEDVEIGIRAWLLGYSVIMVPDAEVAHRFKKEPFPTCTRDEFVYVFGPAPDGYRRDGDR